jgi:hypothetical protein
MQSMVNLLPVQPFDLKISITLLSIYKDLNLTGIPVIPSLGESGGDGENEN